MDNEKAIKALDGLPEDVLRQLFRKPYRKRDKVERIYCPHQDYSECWVELPAEWLGSHAILKDQIVDAMTEAAGKRPPSKEAVNIAVALAVAEEFHIPGLEGDSVEDWDIGSIPIPVIAWLTDVVTTDLMSAYQVPLPFVEGSGGESPEKPPEK